MNPSVQKAMMFGLPALSLAFTWWFPAAVQLSFVTTSAISYLQVSAMQTPWFRSYFKMTPLPTRKPSSSNYPGPQSSNPRSPLSQAELNSRFESSAKPKSLLSEAKEGFQGSIKLAKEKMAQQSVDKELKSHQAYEQRRQKEIAEEKKELARRRAENHRRHKRS
jgi:YidC/Oxa1 family membrane protein insertase